MTSACRYFATVPVSNTGLELSIFVNREFEELIHTSGELFVDDRVLLVVHGVSERGGSSPYDSELSECPLFLGAEQDDWVVGDDGEEIITSLHKLGGRPHTIHDPPEYIQGTRDATALGMRQFLQFDFPAYGEDVSGSWPWGDGLFHVLFRGSLEAAEWASFWEI
jgi:hypothetical protein